MKKWLALCLVLVCACVINVYANEQSLDRIVAVVNKSVITQSELDEAMSRIKKQLEATHTPLPPNATLHKKVLDQLINRTLQLDIAEQMGLRVTEEDITQAIKTIAEKNRITVDTLYASVAEQGLSKESYRKEIRDEITINRVAQQAIGGKITVSPEEINDFMHSTAWTSDHSAIRQTQNNEEQRKQAQELLYQRKYQEALQTWIIKLRSESYINLHPEN